MNSLLFFEQVLLILGILLFLLLCGALIFAIIKNRKLKIFISLFILPIIMIGYPGIKSIQIGNLKVALNEYINKVQENPQDSIAYGKLEEITHKLEGRESSQKDFNKLIDANILMNKPEKANELVKKALEEEEILEYIPFAIIEDVPVYPGCRGNKAQLRACLQEKITKHVNRKFNSNLASDLGLSPGVKKIFVMFKIDKNGNIVDVMARAPHNRLRDEAIRVVKLLPKMTPGKQRGRPIGVKYSLPIAFKVE